MGKQPFFGIFIGSQILFRPESTEGVAEGQTTAVGENYAMSGFEKTETIVDYDDESLRSYDLPSTIPEDRPVT